MPGTNQGENILEPQNPVAQNPENAKNGLVFCFINKTR